MNGTQENTNKQKWNSEELITEVEHTPFIVVETETGHYVTLGKYRMSEAFKTKEEAITDGKAITWFRILQVIGATVENYNK